MLTRKAQRIGWNRGARENPLFQESWTEHMTEFSLWIGGKEKDGQPKHRKSGQQLRILYLCPWRCLGMEGLLCSSGFGGRTFQNMWRSPSASAFAFLSLDFRSFSSFCVPQRKNLKTISTQEGQSCFLKCCLLPTASRTIWHPNLHI